MKNGVWLYNGFSRPERIAVSVSELVKLLKSNKLVINDNYLGEGNGDLIELIESERNDLELLHDDLLSYSLWINPTISEFKKINVQSFGLNENCYLEGLLT